jgi:YYY domain-containing protein
MAVEDIEEHNVIRTEQSEVLATPSLAAGQDERRQLLVLTRERIAVLGLILVLLLGAYLRFTGLNWDLNHHLHPDERFLTEIASQLRAVSDPLLYLRTSESPLNPYNLGKPLYVYGNFPMTATRYIAEWTAGACNNFSDLCRYDFTAYDGIHILGRFLSGFVDLFSILFIFLIGRRLYDWRVGLLAALLLSLAVMPIQQSHFFTMDNWAAALTTVTMYTAVRAAEDGERRRWWLLFGLFLGLTVSSRINLAPLAAMAAVAAVLWLVRRQRQLAPEQGWRYISTDQGIVDLQVAITGVVLAAIISIVTFRLAQPYAFADATIVRETAMAQTGREPSALRVAFGSIFGFNPQWRANMAEIQAHQSPEASFPPALQWTSRMPMLFPLTNMVLYGMGLVAGVVAWLGFLWALWRVVKGRPDWTVHALLVAWISGYFLFMGTRWVQSIRYFLPLYPFLLLLAAWALFRLWDRASASNLKRVASGAAIALTVVPTFLWANAFVDIYQEPLTRVAASRWMFENIPSGVTLVYETGGQEEEMHLPLKGYEFQPGGMPLNLSFVLPTEASTSDLRFNYVTLPAAAPATLQTTLLTSDGETIFTTSGEVMVDGERQPVTLDLPAEALQPDTPYLLRIEHVGGAPVQMSTSRIVNEEWDDLLPVSVDGRPAYAAYYSEVTGGQRPVTWPASEEKRELMLQWINEADVIALSSQRSLWNTPRLPLTYPLNIAYYESLFNGELGFKLAAEFHADLDIGPLHISDTGGEIAWGHYPEIGWPPPGELAAEEAFSVYDHPPVWIFRKTEDYSPEKARAILYEVDLANTIVMNPGEASNAPNAMMMSPRNEAIQRQNGTFDDVFNVDGVLSRQPALGAAAWWLAVVLLGLLAFPITFVALPGLPQRGYALSKVLGLLLLSWLGWIVASYNILPAIQGTWALALLVIAAISLIVFMRHRREMMVFVRQNLAYIGFVELLALSLFLLGIVIRLGNPDVWDVIWGGEKPMDLSYFTAVVKSSVFPPYDPWFAGGYINYYYYGFVFVGALTELLGITPTVAYNLILPMLYSFTGLGAFSVAYNLTRRIQQRQGELRSSLTNHQSLIANLRSLISSLPVLAGLSAVALCILLGNLGEVGVMVGAWERASDSNINTGIGIIDTTVRTLDGALAVTFGGQDAPIYPGDWFWTATRAINIEPGEAAPITEFPFFTFLYGDLHAHMIALPLTLLALAWAVSLVLSANRHDLVAPRRSAIATALLWFSGALAIGVLRPTNTWDWPTYLFLGALAVAFYAIVRNHDRFPLVAIGQALLQIAALAALSTVLFLPYIRNYGAGYESLALWQGSYTYLSNYLVIYGLFLFLVLTHLAREFRAWTATWTDETLTGWRPYARPIVIALFLYVLLLVVLFVRDYWIAPVVLTLTIIAGLLGLRPGISAARRVVLILISSALGLTLMVEIVVLEGDVGRMNTVFKFYMQVWIMLSVAGGVALALAWQSMQRRWSGSRRRSWRVALGVLLALALLYPLLALPAKWRLRTAPDAPRTLDGMVFMRTASYEDSSYDGSSVTVELDDEYQALRWIQRNVKGSPVVAEATPPDVGQAYRSIGSRVAMYTGLPTILGWDWHQQQQRTGLGNLIRSRMEDVAILYNTPDASQAAEIIDTYDVKYIYVGTQERLYYVEEGLQKFNQMAEIGYLREVFRNESVTIYEVTS